MVAMMNPLNWHFLCREPVLLIDGGRGAWRPAWSVINRIRADYPHSRQRSRGGQRPSEHIKADPGAGVPATSGGEPYSGVVLEGWRRCDTGREMERDQKPGCRTGPLHTERRTASVWPTNGCVWPSAVVIVSTSMGSVAVMNVMKGSTTATMNPSWSD